LLCPFIEWRQPTAMAPSSSLIIFVELIRRPNWQYGVPPHVPPLPRVLPDSPPSSTPTYNWLLCVILQNGGHPKAQASSLFALFFDPSNFTPPSERTDDSKRNSNGSWPAHGVGERRHHDLIAPLIYPRREIKKPMSGGSSSWLLCGRTIFCDFFVFVVYYLWIFTSELNMQIHTWSTIKYLRYTHTRHFNLLYIQADRACGTGFS
jgi:hypothetical protein